MTDLITAALLSTAATAWFLIGWMLALAYDLMIRRNRL